MDPKNGAIAVILALAFVPVTQPGPAARAFAQTANPTLRSCGPVLEREVCTWVLMDGAAVLELGVTVPLGLVEAVPADAEMSWPPQELAAIALPEAARARLGIDHLGINWEAHGHPPDPFMTPHFDFHFYSLTSEQLLGVDCADESKPSRLPPGYRLLDIDVPGLGMLVGLCVPRMGMHAIPEDDIERADPFTATMMIGYYRGEAIFFEPMVSRDRLLERSNFMLQVPKTGDLPAGIRYPTDFSAEYDAGKDRYRFVMRGFLDQ